MHKITEVDFVGTKNVLWESKDGDTSLTLYPTYVLDDADEVTLGAGLRVIVDSGVSSTVVLDVEHMRAMAAFLTLSADRLEAGEHLITERVTETITELRS